MAAIVIRSVLAHKVTIGVGDGDGSSTSNVKDAEVPAGFLCKAKRGESPGGVRAKIPEPEPALEPALEPELGPGPRPGPELPNTTRADGPKNKGLFGK